VVRVAHFSTLGRLLKVLQIGRFRYFREVL
jgi:hypothetical protein